MRWLQAGMVVLSVLLTAGCPSEFGKDGRVAKAAHNDSQENLLELTRCSEEWRKEVCGNGPNKNHKKCLECGGP